MKYLLVTSCEEKDFTNSVSEQASVKLWTG